MNQTKRSWVFAVAIAAIVSLAMGCGSRGRAGAPAASGTIQAHLAGALSSPFSSVRVDVSQGGAPVASQTIVPGPLTLPDGTAAQGGDALFILKAGGYEVAATALDASGAPAADCMTATTMATITAGLTTEVMLAVICGGGGNGGLDVVVTVDSPPAIIGMTILPSKFVATNQPVTLIVNARASSGSMPLDYAWSVDPNAMGAQPFLFQVSDHANFQASTPGDYGVTVRVTDARGRVSSLSFPLHVADLPGPPPSQVRSTQRPCRTGDESLEDFAARCDKAMGGVGVGAFDCDVGSTEPPRQSDGSGSTCSAPNVLNQECDPGSHFHMLHRNQNNDGIYIAGHCRRRGNAPGTYADVAVIQYNANTGATCFYQALGTLNHNAPDPRKGTGGFWLTPQQTVWADACVKCHDTGPFVRSPYLAQLGEVWPFYNDASNPLNPNRPNLPMADANYLPGTLAGDIGGPWNTMMPYKFVGLNFQSWEAYSLTNTSDSTCLGCHRMGVSKAAGFWNSGSGTAMDLGMRATGTSQTSKLAHDKLGPGTSPIWMTPGQLKFSQSTANHASAMQKCAGGIFAGQPDSGCSATLLAQGDTCPPPPVEVNGSTVAGDPKSWKNSGKMPLGQPGGRPGFYFFTTIHGPFYQNTAWDPIMNKPPAVASPAWDPPTQAPGFRGTYLRLYVEPAGQWMVAWGLDATDIQNGGNNPSPPGGPGGELGGIAYEQIDSIPDPAQCGLGFFSITDMTGTGSPLSATIDPMMDGSAAILSGFVGNVSRNGFTGRTDIPSVLRVANTGGATVLAQSHTNSPMPSLNQWFTAETWGNGCANWKAGAHYAATHVASTDDVVLVSAPDAPNVICYIDGLAGDWSQWQGDGNGGSVQPYAQIYYDTAGAHLKVWPGANDANRVSATASCLYLKK